MDLNWIVKRLPDEPELRDRLQRALKMLTHTVEMKHELIEALRPSHLDNLGLGFAVRTHCREFTQRTGLPCEVKVEEDFDELDPAWSIALYRVMQEALTNVAQHARAHSVQVVLVREPAGLRLRVLDDGAGIPDGLSSQPSLGLVGMRERMREVGGSVQFSSNASRAGTIVDAFVPFDRVAAQAM
jgi:signal transduction histidine kinase